MQGSALLQNCMPFQHIGYHKYVQRALVQQLKVKKMLVPPTEGLQLGTSPHKEAKQVRC